MRTSREQDFEDFVRANRARLVRLATALTAGDGHLAEDLVQGALVRVYLARPSAIGDAYGYVRRALVNGLIDHHRRPSTRRERAIAELPEIAVPAAAAGADPHLVAALRNLPPRMRAAVVLRHVEGLSVEQAAAALGCSAGNIKSQTARGLDKLRAVLAATSAADDVCEPAHVAHSPIGERPCPTS